MDPNNARHTFDDYLRDRLSDDEWRIEWGGEEAIARAATCLYRARSERGISQTKLADRAGTKQPNISAIENGEGNPTVRTLGRLAAALRVDIAELVGGNDRYGVYRRTEFENLTRRIHLSGSTEQQHMLQSRPPDVSSPLTMQRVSDSGRSRKQARDDLDHVA